MLAVMRATNDQTMNLVVWVRKTCKDPQKILLALPAGQPARQGNKCFIDQFRILFMPAVCPACIRPVSVWIFLLADSSRDDADLVWRGVRVTVNNVVSDKIGDGN